MLRGLFPLTQRYLSNILRAPWFVAFAIVQPLMWLTLFGSLFSQFSGSFLFNGQSYETYLAPGIAVMSAVFGSAYSGVQALIDLNRGLWEKLLTTPASLAAIALANILQAGLMAAIQSLLVVGVALALGARPGSFLIALFGIALVGFLVGLVFSALSNMIALYTRQMPAIMGIVNLLTLPLTFTSSMLMSPPGMPVWMRSIAKFNPINWAVELARQFFSGHVDTVTAARSIGLLLGLAGLLSFAAVQAARRYQKTL
jgi:ABC-2 type transport system permease protein